MPPGAGRRKNKSAAGAAAPQGAGQVSCPGPPDAEPALLRTLHLFGSRRGDGRRRFAIQKGCIRVDWSGYSRDRRIASRLSLVPPHLVPITSLARKRGAIDVRAGARTAQASRRERGRQRNRAGAAHAPQILVTCPCPTTRTSRESGLNATLPAQEYDDNHRGGRATARAAPEKGALELLGDVRRGRRSLRRPAGRGDGDAATQHGGGETAKRKHESAETSNGQPSGDGAQPSGDNPLPFFRRGCLHSGPNTPGTPQPTPAAPCIAALTRPRPDPRPPPHSLPSPQRCLSRRCSSSSASRSSPSRPGRSCKPAPPPPEARRRGYALPRAGLAASRPPPAEAPTTIALSKETGNHGYATIKEDESTENLSLFSDSTTGCPLL